MDAVPPKKDLKSKLELHIKRGKEALLNGQVVVEAKKRGEPRQEVKLNGSNGGLRNEGGTSPLIPKTHGLIPPDRLVIPAKNAHCQPLITYDIDSSDDDEPIGPKTNHAKPSSQDCEQGSAKFNSASAGCQRRLLDGNDAFDAMMPESPDSSDDNDDLVLIPPRPLKARWRTCCPPPTRWSAKAAAVLPCWNSSGSPIHQRCCCYIM